MSSSFMPQIKNVVMLMLENRSLDNLLGWLWADKDNKPHHVYPEGSNPLYDGLRNHTFYNPAWTFDWEWKVKNYFVESLPSGLGTDRDRVPAYDPYEPFRENNEWNGVMNQLFGNQDRIKGLPANNTPPTMNGFLQDYYAWYEVGFKGLDILWTFAPNLDPNEPATVINQLARYYAVSDAWFCSVPSQTNPNRAFSLCGTSLGRESNLNWNAVEKYEIPTIFNGFSDAGMRCGLFYKDVWEEGLSFTDYTFPYIRKYSNTEIATMDRFFALAKTGNLPHFTYIEPSWGYGKGDFFVQGTDYHPPTHIAPGEMFLYEVATALERSPQWKDTLFVITFDEHGGTYDHVAPTWTAINPDGNIGIDGFKFNLFGARVPTILVSPYIRHGTVFRPPAGSQYPFDHTSLIKTLFRWADVPPDRWESFGKRMAAAPTFEGVLASTIVNQSTLAEPQSQPQADDSQRMIRGPINAMFEGVEFAAIRAILNRSTSVPDLHAELAKYKADPGGYLTK